MNSRTLNMWKENIGKNKFSILSISLLFFLSGCANYIADLIVTPNNQIVVVSKNATITKDKMHYFNLQMPTLTLAGQEGIRNEYMDDAIKAVGIKKYKILERQTKTLDPTVVGDSYLAVFSVPKFTATQGSSSCTPLWLTANLAFFQLPEKKEIARISGDSEDCQFGWHIGELVESLLVDMLEEIYKD